MAEKVKRIAVLTSGGDGPGMNAAIRAIVRCGINRGLKVDGIQRGYQGLLKNNFQEMNHRSVSNIINRGGTILKTARSKEFGTPEGKAKAAKILKKRGIDCLLVIGGDGSYRGANELFKEHGIPTIGLPGTIDNDIYGTDETIGCHTAVNTALEAIDKIRDTAHSMERIFVIEVMGNRSGYIATEVALGGGAEEVIVPERDFDFEKMCKDVKEGHTKGKISWMVVVAEGAGHAEELSKTITEMTGLESRYAVLGHIQRGGTPTGRDRILATRLGAAAIECAVNDKFGVAVGVQRDEINIIDLADAKYKEYRHIDEYQKLIEALT